MAAYVTDTHPLLWHVHRHAKLSKNALRIFSKAERGDALIYIPAMVLLECGMLVRLGRFRFKEPFHVWMDALTVQPGFELVELGTEIIAEALALQTIHDPFDLTAIATARSKELPLITADTQIIDSRLVEIAW